MAGLQRVRFLVIDDNVHMISIVKTLLRGYGAKHVFEARDATEGFHRLKNDSIDIVIVDYMMDVLDGIEFVQMVRNSSDSANRYVPIIMLTAHSERSRVISARDAGANEFCCKPVTAHELHKKIAAIVNNPRPFVKAPSYFGPDRRRRINPKYAGEERRFGWTADHQPPPGTKLPTEEPADENDPTEL